jgi:dTDP-4-amino-4,6-dideoxygalactose transaminase
MNIQLFVPDFDVEACLAGVRECLERGWTGDGFKTLELEKAWCAYAGFQNALFVNSGTAALHLALATLRRERGWKDGDEVISTPITFVATNHVILHERLKPVFADVDRYLCLDPASVFTRITPKTRAVIFVGVGGNAGRFHDIVEICKKTGIAVILDGAHMTGTKIAGLHAGLRADAACFSFHAVKPLNTGDSGMLCMKSVGNADVARRLAWFGIDKTTYARAQAGSYRWRYDVTDLGWKYHGNAIMAAIGLAQLTRLEQSNMIRRQLAAAYDQALIGRRTKPIPVAPGCESSRHLYQVECDHRDELIEHLNRAEIFPGVHYWPNTRYPMYAGADCPKAEQAGDRILSLPLHLKMTRDHVAYVARAIQEFEETHGKA